MDNKDEKTFADLFSSSTTEPETTTQTFSDILNGSIEEPKEAPSTITFDSLFDKIPSAEAPEEKQVQETNILEQTNEKIEEPKPEEKTITEQKDSIFSSIIPELPKETSEKNTEQAEPEKEKKTEDIEIKLNDLNPSFFNETTVSTSPTDDELNNKNTNSEKVSEQSNSKFENPFFKSESLNEEEKTTDITNNPFFNNTDENSSNKEEIGNEEVSTNNPFFKDESQSIEDKKEEFNPFFDNNVEKDEIQNLETSEKEQEPKNNNDLVQPTSTILQDKKENDSPKETTVKSSSPFFQEEQKNEENPFFQNQLNLIENQTPNTPSSNIDTTKSKHYNVKIVKKKEPLIKFILGVLSYAIFIFLLLIGITLLVYVLDIKIRAAKGDYSSPTFNAYVVLTGSMLPEIEVNDVVVTKKVDAEKLKEGDVITFASADSRFLGTIITHRIIKKNPATETTGYTFQTKGDNNNVADNELVPESNIYGKVILKIPKLGYLQEFLASDGGWIIVILIPCLTVISYDIVKLIKGLRRKKYKNIKVQK